MTTVDLHKSPAYYRARVTRDGVVLAGGDAYLRRGRCLFGEFAFHILDDAARMPGHVYSRAGLREFVISRCCEYHYDRLDDEEGAP